MTTTASQQRRNADDAAAQAGWERRRASGAHARPSSQTLVNTGRRDPDADAVVAASLAPPQLQLQVPARAQTAGSQLMRRQAAARTLCHASNGAKITVLVDRVVKQRQRHVVEKQVQVGATLVVAAARGNLNGEREYYFRFDDDPTVVHNLVEVDHQQQVFVYSYHFHVPSQFGLPPLKRLVAGSAAELSNGIPELTIYVGISSSSRSTESSVAIVARLPYQLPDNKDSRVFWISELDLAEPPLPWPDRADGGEVALARCYGGGHLANVRIIGLIAACRFINSNITIANQQDLAKQMRRRRAAIISNYLLQQSQ